MILRELCLPGLNRAIKCSHFSVSLFFPDWNRTLIDQAVLRAEILITPSFQDGGLTKQQGVGVTEGPGHVGNLCNVTPQKV